MQQPTFSTLDSVQSASSEVVRVVDAAETSQGWVQLPIGKELLDAQFTRHVQDLLVRVEDVTLLVKHYFAQPEVQGVLAESGVKISASGLEALVGNMAPNQYAGEIPAADSIGVIEKIKGEVVVERQGQELHLQQGDAVYLNDVVKTGHDGSIGVTFEDKSVFTLGGDARMTLDSFMYDPETGDGSSNINVIKGMFKFVSGDIAANNPGEMKVETPVATIGIRGTTGGGSVEGEGGNNQFFLEQNADGTTGWFDVTTAGGTVTMNQPNMLVGVQSFNDTPSNPQVVPAEQLQQNFGTVIEFAPEGQYDARAASENRGENTGQNNNQPQDPQGGDVNQPQGQSSSGQESQGQQGEGGDQNENNAANAEMQTEQAQGEQTAADNQPDGAQVLDTFSGDAQFDGDIGGSGGAMDFIPTSVASESSPPGAPAITGFESASNTSVSHAAAPPPPPSTVLTVNFSPLAAPLPAGGTLSGTSEGNNTAGNILPPPPPVAPVPLAPVIPSTLVNQQQGETPPSSPTPSPTPVPPPAPPPSPPPSPPPLAPEPVGGGGSGGNLQVLFEVTANADNLIGNAAHNVFLVALANDLSIADILDGNNGIDTVKMEAQAAAYVLDFMLRGSGSYNNLTTGIDRFEVLDNLATVRLGYELFDASDTGTIRLNSGNNGVIVQVEDLRPVHTLVLENEGGVTLNGTGGAADNLILRNVSDQSVNVTVNGGMNAGFLLDGGTNTINKAVGVNSIFVSQLGGMNHHFVLGAGDGSAELTDVDGATISGGDSGRDIQLVDVSGVRISQGGGSSYNEFYLNNTTNTTIMGHAQGSDEFFISGTHTGLTIDAKSSGGGLANHVFLDEFSGDANIALYGGDSIDAEIADNSVDLTISNSTVAGGDVSLKLWDQEFSPDNMEFEVLDLGGAADKNDLLIRFSATQEIVLEDFFDNATFDTGSDNYLLYGRSNPNNHEYFLGNEQNQPWDLKQTEFNQYAEAEMTINVAALTVGDTLTIDGVTFTFIAGTSAGTNINVSETLESIITLLNAGLSPNNIMIGYNVADDVLHVQKTASGNADFTLSRTGVAVNVFGGVSNFNDYFDQKGTQAAHYQETVIGTVRGSIWNDYLETSQTLQTLYGKLGNDHLYAAHADTSLSGGGGDDVLVRESSLITGYVSLEGGAGFDIVDYQGFSNVLNVNLGSGSTIAGGGNDFYMDAMEGVRTGSGADYIVGNALDNWIDGGAGADTINGGSGVNTASYGNYTLGVNIDLSIGSAAQSGGEAGNEAIGDELTNIQNIIGSRGDDIILGDAIANSLWGNEGSDSLDGGAGVDLVDGGMGDDTVLGGAGDDTVTGGAGIDFLSGGTGKDRFVLDAVSTDTIADFTVVDGDYLDISELAHGKNYFELLAENCISTVTQGADLLVKVKDEAGVQHTVASLTGHASTVLDFSHFIAGKGVHSTVSGGTADSDVLFAPAANDSVFAGLGDDVMADNGFANFGFYGGEGNDVLHVSVASTIGNGVAKSGGAGEDLLYLAFTDSINTNAFNNVTDIEDLFLEGTQLIIGEADTLANLGDDDLVISGDGAATVTFQNPDDWRLLTAADGIPFAQEHAGYSTYISNAPGVKPVVIYVQNGLVS